VRLTPLLILAALLTGCAADPPESPTPMVRAAAPSQPAAKASSGDAVPVASNATPPNTASKDPSEIICRREPVPNTRLGGQKVCMKREDWDRRADVAAEAWREQQRPAMPETGD
jgi:hypothetical protein